jgi:hypothetical protein
MVSLILFGLSLVIAADGGSLTEADRSAYESAKKEAGRDAKAHVRLALWCESHGLGSERLRHLAMAVLYDPSNGLARGLMGLVAYQGKWERPDQVSRQVQDDPQRKALMQEYFQRRANTPDRADDQWKLALWCEQNGLKDQAIAQYHAVLRRDPTRETVWKRLGFKKVSGQWIKPEWQAAQKHEFEQQNRANKHWKPLLEKWREAIFGRDKTRRAQAEEAMTSVTDPRAVPMIWAVFVPRGADGQKVAVRLLGQIDAPGSSRALALLGLSSGSAEARQEAMQLLRNRDARDFAPLLIGLIRDPIQYEVKPVRGPGQTGELVIHDGSVNRKRLYTPLSEPNVPLGPYDSITMGPDGLPVVSRPMNRTTMSFNVHDPGQMAKAAGLAGIPLPVNSGQASEWLRQVGLPAAQSQKLGQTMEANSRFNYQLDFLILAGGIVPFGGANFLDLTMGNNLQIPIGQIALDAQRSAQVAAMQLTGDVKAIESYNAPIREANRRVRQVLSECVGTDKGDDHDAWVKWIVDLFGFAYAPQKASTDETTVIEQVPLNYQPQATPPVVQGGVVAARFRHACFGAGTPVQTVDGPRPIEDLLAGDDVLTQNPKTGALRYQPLVAVYHNPPNATFRVELEGVDESIVATGIHRLWKAGKGWAMVRDLKARDVLRTLGGSAVVKSVTADHVQPVFNLRVADGESFFVGRSGILAHDNSTINPTPEPFDLVESLPGPGTRPTAKRSVLGR